ncbi:hypothetical protein ACET33_35510, partial [Pseudomonas aeruginosa]
YRGGYLFAGNKDISGTTLRAGCGHAILPLATRALVLFRLWSGPIAFVAGSHARGGIVDPDMLALVASPGLDVDLAAFQLRDPGQGGV